MIGGSSIKGMRLSVHEVHESQRSTVQFPGETSFLSFSNFFNKDYLSLYPDS